MSRGKALIECCRIASRAPSNRHGHMMQLFGRERVFVSAHRPIVADIHYPRAFCVACLTQIFSNWASHFGLARNSPERTGRTQRSSCNTFMNQN